MKIPLTTASNVYCPQTFYTYGTYKEVGTLNFGMFCYFSYCWDGELCVMACIGGEKLTKDRIKATGVFSAIWLMRRYFHWLITLVIMKAMILIK